MTNKIDRTGEERIMNNGMKATIIRYRNNRDIDIKFEDGYIKENIFYSSFQEGKVKHPFLKTDNKAKRKSSLDYWKNMLSRANNEHIVKDIQPIKMLLYVMNGWIIIILKYGLKIIIMK